MGVLVIIAMPMCSVMRVFCVSVIVQMAVFMWMRMDVVVHMAVRTVSMAMRVQKLANN